MPTERRELDILHIQPTYDKQLASACCFGILYRMFQCKGKTLFVHFVQFQAKVAPNRDIIAKNQRWLQSSIRSHPKCPKKEKHIGKTPKFLGEDGIFMPFWLPMDTSESSANIVEQVESSAATSRLAPVGFSFW